MKDGKQTSSKKQSVADSSTGLPTSPTRRNTLLKAAGSSRRDHNNDGLPPRKPKAKSSTKVNRAASNANRAPPKVNTEASSSSDESVVSDAKNLRDKKNKKKSSKYAEIELSDEDSDEEEESEFDGDDAGEEQAAGNTKKQTKS